MTRSTPVVGVDIGGTGIKGAVVDLASGALVSERIRLPTPSPATLEAMAGVVGQVLDQIGVEGPVGLTLPAVVVDGIVKTASNIDRTCIGVDAVELFGRATGREVAVVNDADAAGIAEVRFGAGQGRNGVVVLVTLGTGIGSAIFTGGMLVPNSELGHLHMHHADAEKWAAESVREHDDLSWKTWSARLQEFLQLVERALWPELIIIGGGVSKRSDRFLPRIDLDTEIVPARLMNEAGIVGAALFAPDLPGAAAASS